MKNNIYKKLSRKIKGIISLASLALLVFVVSCEIPKPEDILELRIDTNIFTHKVFVVTKDLQNQSNLSGSVLKAKLTVEGSNQDIIVSEGGKITDVYNLKDGIGAFAVNPKYRGFSDPINFSLEIYGENYLTKTVSVTINPQDSITQIRETMLNTTQAPSGVATAQQSASLTGGSNTAPVTVNTNTSSTNTTAGVVVPSDNVFKDANGNAITSGNLSAQVVYFDGNDNGASASSNNSNIQTLKDENGTILTNVVISPVATADINMSVGSTEVKQFDKDIEVSLDVNSDFTNPATGAKVKVGDIFDIYSTSDNGNWEYQSKGTLVSENGKLVVKFNTNHLSTFTLGTVVNKCSTSTSFIALPDNGQGFGASYTGKFLDAQNATISTTTAVKETRSGVVGLSVNNVPSQQAKLSLTSSSSSTVETGLLDWCGAPTISSTTLDALKLNGETVNLTVSAKCGDNASISPSGVVLYIEYQTGSNTFVEVGVMQNGKISVPGITINQEYRIRVYYDGDSGDGTYTFNSNNIVIEDYPLPGDICNELGF